MDQDFRAKLEADGFAVVEAADGETRIYMKDGYGNYIVYRDGELFMPGGKPVTAVLQEFSASFQPALDAIARQLTDLGDLIS